MPCGWFVVDDLTRKKLGDKYIVDVVRIVYKNFSHILISDDLLCIVSIIKENR